MRSYILRLIGLVSHLIAFGNTGFDDGDDDDDDDDDNDDDDDDDMAFT